MIIIAGYVNYKTYHMPCPADPELGRACEQTRKRSRYIYYVSVGIFIFAHDSFNKFSGFNILNDILVTFDISSDIFVLIIYYL